MNQDRKTGRFTKGNKAQKKADPRVKCAKALCKVEIGSHVSSLFTEEMKIVTARVNKGSTIAFRHILDNAIIDKDTSFIKWLIEMFVGKPKTVEDEDFTKFTENIIDRVDNNQKRLERIEEAKEAKKKTEKKKK